MPLSLVSLHRLVGALFLLCLGASAQAAFHRVDRDDRVHLEGNEGLVVIAVDSNMPVSGLRIKRVGSLASTIVRDIKDGITTQIYSFPSGDYQIEHFSVEGGQFSFADNIELRFTVKPGVVNYPGDIVFRASAFGLATARMSNRALRSLDWLESNRPDLFRGSDFVYVGHYPDPFPAYYRKALEQHRDATRTPLDTLPAPPPLAIAQDDLWKPQRLRSATINPSGHLVAELVQEDRHNKLDLIDLDSGSVLRLSQFDVPVQRLTWLSDHTLLLGLGRDARAYSLVVLRLSGGEGKPVQAEQLSLPKPGNVVRELSASGEHLLWSFAQGKMHQCVVLVDVSSKPALAATRFKPDACLNQGVDDDLYWMANQAGVLKAVLRKKDGNIELLHGDPGNYRLVLSSKDNVDFDPLGLSPDGNQIYGRTEKDRNQHDLVVLDPATGKIGATLFSQPEVDVIGLLADPQGTALGVTYYRNGLLASVYFDATANKTEQAVEAAFPDRSAIILDRDAKSEHMLLSVEGGAQPLALYHLDNTRHKAELLDEGMPWIAAAKLGPTHAIKATASDGKSVEGYLTLPPKGVGKPPYPLVIMPHGGPIGIRDVVSFDPEVQLVAGLGYAVLRVNFRGSTGYGQSFRTAAEGQYGNQIENDIDSVLQVAWAKEPLDRERSCAIGASYGGYSSLVMAIRWPGRLRCVVSMMGVSDRPLFFTASDAALTEDRRKELEKIIGNPVTDMEKLIQYSPLYHVDALTMPVLLIHGEQDVRVDFEHTRRLVRMLALNGRPPFLIDLPQGGHNDFLPQDRTRIWIAIASFLHMNLSAEQ